MITGSCRRHRLLLHTAFVGWLTPAGPPADRVRAMAVLQPPAVHLAVRQGVNR